MCCFSAPVRYVGQTRIFARVTRPGMQGLAYQMNFEAEQPVAMLLPIPTLRGVSEGTVRFLDLSGYSTFFQDVEQAFPAPGLQGGGFGGGYGGGTRSARPTLAVESVGDFVASFVPSLGDFDRLDPRFRLPRHVWSALPQYREYGFAVFQLKPGRGRQTVHPMAFEFPTALRDRLYFPTVHIHDGKVHAREKFDHTLYLQVSRLPMPTVTLEKSPDAAGRVVKVDAAQGLIHPEQPVYKMNLRGLLANRDTFVKTG